MADSIACKHFFSIASSPTGWALNKAVTLKEKKRHCSAATMAGIAATLTIPSALKHASALLVKIFIATFALTIGQIPSVKAKAWSRLEQRSLVASTGGRTVLALAQHVYQCVMFLTFSPLCCLLVGPFSATACRKAHSSLHLTAAPENLKSQKNVKRHVKKEEEPHVEQPEETSSESNSSASQVTTEEKDKEKEQKPEMRPIDSVGSKELVVPATSTSKEPNAGAKTKPVGSEKKRPKRKVINEKVEQTEKKDQLPVSGTHVERALSEGEPQAENPPAPPPPLTFEERSTNNSPASSPVSSPVTATTITNQKGSLRKGKVPEQAVHKADLSILSNPSVDGMLTKAAKNAEETDPEAAKNTGETNTEAVKNAEKPDPKVKSEWDDEDEDPTTEQTDQPAPQIPDPKQDQTDQPAPAPHIPVGKPASQTVRNESVELTTLRKEKNAASWASSNLKLKLRLAVQNEVNHRTLAENDKKKIEKDKIQLRLVEIPKNEETEKFYAAQEKFLENLEKSFDEMIARAKVENQPLKELELNKKEALKKFHEEQLEVLSALEKFYAAQKVFLENLEKSFDEMMAHAKDENRSLEEVELNKEKALNNFRTEQLKALNELKESFKPKE